MTSDSSKFRTTSGEPDSTFSDSDATVLSGGEPSPVEPTILANPPLFFDDESTKTSALPTAAEQDEENERTVASRTAPTEPTSESVDEDGVDGGALPPGAKFGRFVVTKYIGGGGMGRVYEGRDAALDRKVAIKVLPRQRARDVGAVARFLNEAKSAARLNHEHIAQVYFCGEENGVPFIAFEYVRGVNLRDYVRERGVLELGEAIDYVLQAADALAHAAEHGVTHRDVKPSNIIVSPEKSVKLIDMGLARLQKSDLDDDLTESGVTLGTFDYISPEQARDPRAADARSDIYSLGCTFYYMLVGTPPFPEGTMLQKLLQHQGDEPPDVREANPEIPVEVAAVVKKMMRKAPEERYQTPKSLILDLYEIAEMIGVRVSERGVSDEAFDARRTVSAPARTPAAIACALLAALFVGLRWSSGGATIPLPVVETPTTPSAATTAPSETNATESGVATATDSTGATSGGESETSATTARVETLGETFGAAEIDATRAEELAGIDLAPPLVVDDGAEWRRTFLSGSATVGDSKRVAWGWRASRRVAASSGTAGGGASFRAIAYSTLGTSATAAGGGASSTAPTASAVRTVDRVGDGEQTFATLQAALAVGAGSTDATPIRVELKFDGPLATPPISLVGRKAEIVAAEGFRPTLSFDPRGAVEGWGERMFLLNSSELTLRGVAVDFTVPAQDVVASKWSVFESIGASVLTLVDSTATVCNATGEAFSAPLHSNVAIFRSTFDAAALDGLDASATASDDRAAPTVRLDGVFARGEAALFATNGVGGALQARRSAINVSGSIFLGGEEERAPTGDDAGSGAALTFDRVVVAARSPFVARSERDDATAASAAPPLVVSATNSLVWLDGAPLELVHSSRNLETAPTASAWKLDGSLLLDAEPSLRAKSRQAATVRSWPLAFDEPPNASAKLSDLNSDAAARLAQTPPHRFELADFERWILEPAQTSSALDAATRALAEEMRATLFGTARDADGFSGTDAEKR